MKSVTHVVPPIIILIIGVLGLILLADQSFENPLARSFVYDFPVYVTGDAEGNSYSIDTSLRRVSKISVSEVNEYNLMGGSRDGSSFFYATQIAVSPGGRLFLLDELRDEKGFYVLKERILSYDKNGNFEGEVTEIEYPEGHFDPTLVQRARIITIESRGEDGLEYALLSENALERYRMDLTPGESFSVSPARLVERYDFPNALLNIADAALGESEVYASLRNGRIVRLDPSGEHELLFDAPAASELIGQRIVPWELDIGPDGQIFFIDLEARAVRDISGRIIIDRDIVAAGSGDEELYPYDYYRLDVSADGRIFVPLEGGQVVIAEPGGSVILKSSASIPFSSRILSVLWWLSALLLAGSVLWLLWRIYDRYLDRHLPQLVVNAVAILVLVAAVGGLSTVLLVDNFNSRYTDVIFDRINQMIQIFPLVIDGDDLESIDSLEDFGNQEYMTIRNDLLDAFNRNRDDWNRGYYFALYRIIDERLYGFMYMNGAIGMYHPFDWLLGPDEPGVYDLADMGEIAGEMIIDISGEWIYGVGPIYNSAGEVVGLFETGTDLYTLTAENERLISELIWELVTVLIVIMLLSVEVTVLSNLMASRKSARVPLSDSDAGFSDSNMARPLVFLFFAAISFSIAFLPLLSRNLYQPIAGLSRDLVIALPISIEMALFGIATVFTGFLTQKAGWKPVFSVALVLGMTGLLLSALAGNLGLFLLARGTTGLASGMGYIALRSFINLEGRREKRGEAYSNFYSGMVAGVNVGLVLGASIASITGFANVFYIGLVVMVITATVFAMLYRDTRFFWKAPVLDDLGTRRAVFSLMKSPRLWMYFVLLILPTYAAASYIGYYFPLFAEDQGLATAEIGRFMIMNGLFIVYLGPILARFVEKRFGSYWGSILGSVFWGLALVLAAFSGNMLTAALVLILMGLTEGFAVTAQNNLFFSESAVRIAGEDRATGYFELFGKIGETVGPMVFAALLVLGQVNGLLILGLAVAALGIPYLILVRKPRPSEGQKSAGDR